MEVDLKLRGMRIPALDLRLPKQKGKRGPADQHSHDLQKQSGASIHEFHPSEQKPPGTQKEMFAIASERFPGAVTMGPRTVAALRT